MDERAQTESVGRRHLVELAIASLCAAARPAEAQERLLDPAGATFRDYATMDNGSSYYRIDGMGSTGDASNLTVAKLLGVDNDRGAARVRFEAVKTELVLPQGWQAAEDWERGLAYSPDKRYRFFAWRVDFPYEGVRDAEHYAATKSGAIQARRPKVKAEARKLGDGSFLIVYENVAPVPNDSQPRVVFDVLLTKEPKAKGGVLLTLGVPQADGERGLRLMALIKASAKPDW